MSDALKAASITRRLADTGSDRWAVHFEARRRAKAGEDIIELTIGEPDIPTPEPLIDVAHQRMREGRTRYSGGRGEPAMIAAVAAHYSKRTGRDITAANVLCVPGTQAALALTMLSLVEVGDDVLVPDPYYATYEGVVKASGARLVPVPMQAENGFHLTADQLENAITPRSKVLLLNTPHNPSGAVLSASEIAAIGAVCKHHNLWIVSDEVYEQLVYDGAFASPFDNADLADRTIALSSISKSHAAPGFRSGWCVGPAWFTNAMQPVSETFLFGSQPFISDMTAHALAEDTTTARRMADNYKRRIALLMQAFAGQDAVQPLKPEAGMFMLVDVSRTGLTGENFALALLREKAVATMPGSSFGAGGEAFIRLSLTVDDALLTTAAERIVDFAASLGAGEQR